MNTNGHYTVEHYTSGEVRNLVCTHCEFYVSVIEHRRAGDKSGQGRYNRARAVMVKHLHSKHLSELVANPGQRGPTPA